MSCYNITFAERFSSVSNIVHGCTDLTTDQLDVIFGLTIVEVIGISLSLIIVGIFFYALMYSRNSFHIRILTFFYALLSSFYIYVTVRILTLLFASFCLIEDISYYGPLKLAYAITETCLIFGSTVTPLMTVDCFLATRNPEAYELQHSRTFALLLVGFSFMSSFGMEVFRYFDIISVVFMSLIILLVNAWALCAMYFIYKTNKRKLQIIEQSLSKKYQIRENLRVCAAVIPFLILASVAGFVGGILYTVIVMMNDSNYLSIYGPWRALHILRECALVIGGILFPCVTLDRLIATRDPEEYEKKTKPTIAIILVFMSIVAGLSIQALVASNTFSLAFMPTVVAGINLIGTVMMYFVMKKNNLNMDQYYNFALGYKLQLRENIQTCTAIYPNLILSSICTIVGASFYIGAVFITNDRSLSLLFVTIFNSGVVLYMNVSPLMFFFFIKQMRERILIYFCNVRRVRCEQLDAHDLYFQQLYVQWNT